MNPNEPIKNQDYKNASTYISDGYTDITQQLIDNASDSPQYDPRSPTDRDIPLKDYLEQIDEYFKTEEAQKEKELKEKEAKEAKEKEAKEAKEQEKNKKYTSSSKIYTKNIINSRVYLNINEIGNNIEEVILQKLKNNYEGKCSKEGFIRKKSVKLVTYSSGLIKNNKIAFDVVYECLICKPVQGMIIKNCAVKNITKAGIRAETKEEPSPVVIFISRDHHYNNIDFSNVKEGDSIIIRVIGIRYELNDKYISIIAEFLDKYVPQKRIITFKSKNK